MPTTQNTWIEQTLTNLSPEARVGQMMMVGFQGLTAPPHILEWLSAGRAGSIVLFARNVASPRQVAELTASLREAAPLPILICIDQEGGIVARMRAGEAFTESPGNMALGAGNSNNTTKLATRVARVMGREMRAVGIDWTLAPCLDVLSNHHNPVVGVRSYGADPARIAELGVAQIKGFQEGGVAACAKHFPGHGNTHIDSHVDLPRISSDLTQLQDVELKPFAAAIEAGVDTIMVAHIVFAALDAEYPATFARSIQQGLLREQMGFKGVITTDCMEMKAITDRYGAGESTVLAALAGTDSIVHSHTPERQEAAYDAVLAAMQSGRLPGSRVEASVRRLLTLKAKYAHDFARKQHVTPSLREVGSAPHAEVGLEAARRGLTLIRGTLPPLQDHHVTLIEFSRVRSSKVEENAHTTTQLQDELAVQIPNLRPYTLTPTSSDEEIAHARQLAAKADLLIVATRSAHLNRQQLALAAEMLAAAPDGQTILLCLRNPWDAAALPDAPNVLATLGDAWPSVRAAVEALTGKTKPSGKLPVPLA